jgi:hypothetical protein
MSSQQSSSSQARDIKIQKMKKCSVCKNEFPASLKFFYKDRDGLTSKCKTCRNKKKKEYYEKNRIKILEDAKKYREKNRIKILKKKKEYYEKNRIKINEKSKEHYEKNKIKLNERRREKVECKNCKSKISRDGLAEHRRTKKCFNK